MLTVQTIDVILRVEPSVHNELGLAKAQNIKIFKKMFDGL